MTTQRGPEKRRVKPVESPALLLDLQLADESSDDSDFRIEDHPDESDDCSRDNSDRGDSGSGSDDDSDPSDDEHDFKTSHKLGDDISIKDVLDKAKDKEFKFPGEVSSVLICAGCLGSRSDDYNEIVECDGCGVTVHEGCYGVSDAASASSTVSSASTEPWFCEACKAGVTDPSCELCPNRGGIFKETEVGAWVHLVCALYVPGVAFSEVERLSGVTLFEMAYSRWGARACSLCEEASVARAGVVVGCDAGLCRAHFHVTCGQAAGLLAEAHTDEADHADPFYAHCRLHSDRALVAARRRNWQALQLRTHARKLELQNELTAEEKARIQRKLIKYRRKYMQQKANRNPPWVPTQKMARLLYSSAGAMRQFERKAACMGVEVRALEGRDAALQALKDAARRWHVPAAFSVDFVAYYLQRHARVTALRRALRDHAARRAALHARADALAAAHARAAADNAAALAALGAARAALARLGGAAAALVPRLAAPPPAPPPPPPPSTPRIAPLPRHARESARVPTAAALKMGVGFPLSDNPDATHGKVLSTALRPAAEAERAACAACGRAAWRRALAACGGCGAAAHAHCLRGRPCARCAAPRRPLRLTIKPPRRRAFTGPQLTNTPLMSITPLVAESPPRSPSPARSPAASPARSPARSPRRASFAALLADRSIESSLANLSSDIAMYKAARKRRKERHRARYSPSPPAKAHKHKRKRRAREAAAAPAPAQEPAQPRITIKLKPLPGPAGAHTQLFYVPAASPHDTHTPAQVCAEEAGPAAAAAPHAAPAAADGAPRARSMRGSRGSGGAAGGATGGAAGGAGAPLTHCDVCLRPGDHSNLVRCDECARRYHWRCLEPPLSRNPKKRGYSWHCADCDPTEPEDNN